MSETLTYDDSYSLFLLFKHMNSSPFQHNINFFAFEPNRGCFWPKLVFLTKRNEVERMVHKAKSGGALVLIPNRIPLQNYQLSLYPRATPSPCVHGVTVVSKQLVLRRKRMNNSCGSWRIVQNILLFIAIAILPNLILMTLSYCQLNNQLWLISKIFHSDQICDYLNI